MNSKYVQYFASSFNYINVYLPCRKRASELEISLGNLIRHYQLTFYSTLQLSQAHDKCTKAKKKIKISLRQLIHFVKVLGKNYQICNGNNINLESQRCKQKFLYIHSFM